MGETGGVVSSLIVLLCTITACTGGDNSETSFPREFDFRYISYNGKSPLCLIGYWTKNDQWHLEMWMRNFTICLSSQKHLEPKLLCLCCLNTVDIKTDGIVSHKSLEWFIWRNSLFECRYLLCCNHGWYGLCFWFYLT